MGGGGIGTPMQGNWRISLRNGSGGSAASAQRLRLGLVRKAPSASLSEAFWTVFKKARVDFSGDQYSAVYCRCSVARLGKRPLGGQKRYYNGKSWSCRAVDFGRILHRRVSVGE